MSGTFINNVVPFVGLVVGVPAVLPHGLNLGGTKLIPTRMVASASGFTITADDTNVTAVRNTAKSAEDVNVLVEYWFDAKLDGFSPFVILGDSGSGAGVVHDDALLGDGSVATPLGIVGGPLAAGQFGTNGNGVAVKTFSGVLATVELRAYDGDPNTIVPADIGSILMDRATPALWQNIDGATAWTKISATGGGATPFFDTVTPPLVFDINVPVFPHTNFDVAPPVPLGQNTLIPFTTNSGGLHLRSLSGGAGGKIVGLYNVGATHGGLGSTNSLFVDNDTAGGVAGPDGFFTTIAGGTIGVNDIVLYIYDGTRSMWLPMGDV